MVRARQRSGFLLPRPGWWRSGSRWDRTSGYALTHSVPNWIDPVDLRVYRFGGLIAAHVALVRPAPGLAAVRLGRAAEPEVHLAAVRGAGLLRADDSRPARAAEARVAIIVVALIAAIWFTLGGLPQFSSGSQPQPTAPAGAADAPCSAPAGRVRANERAARAGVTLLGAGVLFWTEPVQRTLYLGQIELVLMALIMLDAGGHDRRPWKGAGIGLAAGIKLVR